MELHIEKLLDRIGIKILTALQQDARISFSRLGREVGLSAPAIAERVKKMEEAGIIRGYHAHLDPAVMGRSVSAFIHLTTDPHHYPAVKSAAADMAEVVACHHISGNASFVLKVRVEDVADLESVVARFSRFGQTSTAIVLSTAVDKAAMVPLNFRDTL